MNEPNGAAADRRDPDGFIVVVEPNDRIHFLDWGGPQASGSVLLVHGVASTGWSWAPVARRVAAARHTVTVDLRGHGLSDAPTGAYDAERLAGDVVAVAEGAGLLGASPVVLAGHGFGAIVAAAAAATLADEVAGLVLVDGGWEEVAATTGLDPDEFLRTIDEPPEVLRSMSAFLADRRGFDPTTWDADQERAARESVVELPAGRVVSVTRRHVLEAVVAAMFAYRPLEVLPTVRAPITALMSADDDGGARSDALARADAAVTAAGHPPIKVHRFAVGHNLMRYVPGEVAEAILRAGTIVA